MDEGIDSVHLEGLKVEFGYDGQQDSKRGYRECRCPCRQITLLLLVSTHDKMGFTLHEPSVLVGLICEDPLAAKNLVSFCFGFIDDCPGLEHIEMFIDVFSHLVLELTLKMVTM